MFNRRLDKAKIYNVYVKKDSPRPIETIEFVPEGFSIWGFLFTFVWAIFHRAWWLAAALIIANILIELVKYQGLLGEEAIGALVIGISFWVGFDGNEWRASALERHGYILFDIVAARNESEAYQRFLDVHRHKFGEPTLSSALATA